VSTFIANVARSPAVLVVSDLQGHLNLMIFVSFKRAYAISY